MNGLLGKKLGMTQVYDDGGRRVAVTVLEVGPCTVTQLKSADADGYDAIQLGYGDARERCVSKPRLGHLKKAGSAPKRWLKEFANDSDEEVKAGDTVTSKIFDGVSHVDVTSVSKGRGFQGVVKRHKMAGGRMTHGGHSKRRPGAIGQCAYPARVAKGQRMPGHMGARTVTTQNLRVVQVDHDENLLFLSGSVPGPTGGMVTVRKALKKRV